MRNISVTKTLDRSSCFKNEETKLRFDRKIISFGILAICLFLYGCSSRCWICEKEKDSLYIEDYTEELIEVAFESTKGMGDLLRCVFVQYKNTHQSTLGSGYFVHVNIVDEGLVHLSSHNAVLNPYLKLCDTNNDLLIADQEVMQFNETYGPKENPK